LQGQLFESTNGICSSSVRSRNVRFGMSAFEGGADLF
jgi:hypothetical protein